MAKTLYPYIFKRKSVRKFNPTPLNQKTLGEIEEYLNNIKPLIPGIEVKGKIMSPVNVKTVQRINAPHFMVITSETKLYSQENAGFIFEQLCLYLASREIASCWLGMGKLKKDVHTELPFMHIIAFGRAHKNDVYREVTDFKRKSLSEVAVGDDNRLEAARLAPSSMNKQPWFFVSDTQRIYVFKKKGFMESSDLNIGIALAHLKVASDYQKKTFEYFIQDNPPRKNGYQYMGTVLSKPLQY